jgi:hypothetical protein
VEITTRPQRTGPATQALFDLIHRQLADPLGLDTTDAVFRSLDGYLRQAGLEEVARREVELPIGQWGGRVGSFLATDARAAGTRLCEVLSARSPEGVEEVEELLRRSLEEFEQHRAVFPIAIAYGRKPA